MNLHGAPNDIIQNLNPISIVLLIPIFDFLIYPALRKAHIRFTPIKRMACGFFCASAAMLAATITQYYIYKLSPCGTEAATCRDADDNVLYADINVWVQAVAYVLIGISEIFTSITGLEYAFSKAPSNMRSLVMAVNLLMNAFSSAIAQALVGLANDPLLVWNYGVVCVLSFAGGVLFWWCFRGLDKDEDKWNMIEQSAYRGKKPINAAIEADEARDAPTMTHESVTSSQEKRSGEV